MKNTVEAKQLWLQLQKEKSVAIFCHIRPDGDTVGSALALMLTLKKYGISAKVFCDDVIPARLNYLVGVNEFSNVFFGEYSALIAIDCADIYRLGAFANEFVEHKNTYSIDHHVSNTYFAKANYVKDNSSNAENVFEVISQSGIEIDSDIANALATGVITDTGNFKHKNVNKNTFIVASKLCGYGADFNKIVYYNFTMQSKQRAKLLGIVASKIRYFLEDRFAVLSVKQEDFELSGAKMEETEGFIDFIMGIDTVEVGACVMQIAKDKYKISFRSKGVDVNAVASVFGGGGHVLASGCQISGEYEEVVDRIRYAVKQHIKE